MLTERPSALRRAVIRAGRRSRRSVLRTRAITKWPTIRSSGGVEVFVGEAELHQPSLLAPRNLLQHLVVLTLPSGEFSRPDMGSVDLCGGSREAHLVLRHG